ncbi:MAG: proton extrusion protein PcxA [Oculatellaceae cyanobacterium Prado106]|jgi:hypothetical protein|nr:proton extrusion protein PcxA [Oculatellaceae cyanobacterium Prado106]
MQTSFWDSIRNSFRNANQWLLRTPGRSLDEAYEAARKIQEIENDHFGGNKISPDYGNYGSSAQSYFQGELKKYLDIIKIRLAEFKLSSSVVRLSNQRITEISVDENQSNISSISVDDQPALILRKLRFVDEMLERYQPRETAQSSLILLSERNGSNSDAIELQRTNETNGLAAQEADEKSKSTKKSLASKSGVLPRSILDTVDRIKQELDPEAEQEMVRNFRKSKTRTLTALRFILILIIVPLLTQQVAKNFMVGPIVDHYRNQSQEVSIVFNAEMEERALNELRLFEERMRFEVLIGHAEPKSDAEIQNRVRERALALEAEYRELGSDAVKNVFSDMLAVTAFIGVLLTSRREIEIVKSFIDQLVYGLSDSAKAFFIILFTDMFVGFHSPHGWEVILEGVAQHFGLPPDRSFIFLFIATFPVILDTIFKYWIFRYLNRASPSAVATYRSMNE